MNRKQWFLIFTLFLPLLLLLLVRSFAEPNYIFSSLYKIVFLAPFLYAFLYFRSSWKKYLLRDFSFLTFKRNFFSAILWGVLFAGVYALAFLFFRNFLSFEDITTSLQAFASITPTNILFIGVYIILFNSLLEEFFWRGFFFQNSVSAFSRFFAYILTGVGFSLYHIAFLYSWFSLSFVLLASLGLFFYSVFMCYLFEKYKDLFTCWLIHAIVDVAQIAIALVIFGVL